MSDLAPVAPSDRWEVEPYDPATDAPGEPAALACLGEPEEDDGGPSELG